MPIMLVGVFKKILEILVYILVSYLVYGMPETLVALGIADF